MNKKKVIFIVVFCLTLFAILNAKKMPEVNVKEILTIPNEKIWVYEVNDMRCLSFEKPLPSANQTCIQVKNPEELVFQYQKVMLSAFYLNPHIKRVLMIGLGGGTLAMALKNIVPEMKIDIVEINQKMLQIAKQYFYFKVSENIKVFFQDGFEFVKSGSHGQYDLIILDAFGENDVPDQFLSQEFISYIQNNLKKDGIFTCNTNVYAPYSHLLEELHKNNFAQFYDIVLNNRIIIAGMELNHKNIKKNAELFEERFHKIGVDKDFLLEKIAQAKISHNIQDKNEK